MGTLTLLITGASGFLGRACVSAALARGHKVRALSRHATTWPDGVEAIVADLSEGLEASLLTGVDAILHTAASVSNDADALSRDTIWATERLVAGAETAKVPPLVVLASSIAVYDGDATGVIDEATALEPDLGAREAYVGAKCAQEVALCQSGLRGWCLRIGALYDDERRWNAHIGAKRAALLVSLGRKGEVPLLHVQDAAEAMVRAAETAPDGPCEALNIVETAPPSRAEYIAQEHNGLHVPLPWQLLVPFAWLTNALLGQRAPGLLRPKVLRARMQAVSYSNDRAKARLGWLPQKQFVRRAE